MLGASCSDTLDLSPITVSSAFLGLAESEAKGSKSKKNESVASGYQLVPFSVKISDVIGPSNIALI